MDLANIVLYLGSSLLMLGLSLNSAIQIKTRFNISNSGSYWTIASYAFTLSCIIFLAYSWIGIWALLLGSVIQVGSDVFLVLLFRCLNTQIRKSLIVFLGLAFIIVAISLSLMAIYGGYILRVTLLSIITIVLSIWQLYELQLRYKKDKSIYLALIFAAISLQVIMLSYRIWLTAQGINPHITILDEHQPEFLARLAIVLCYIIIFIFIGNYFFQKLWLLANTLYINQESEMLAVLNSLARARDDETGSHILRTQNYALALAQRLKQMGHYEEELTDATLKLMYKAAPLHDLGKVAIPDAILKKPGKLSSEEMGIMRTHSAVGASILNTALLHSSNINDVLLVAAKIAGAHHEKWDGSGYPEGLKGAAIPLLARIMAVADVYDSLVAERPYKKPWTHEEAALEIIANKGIAFEPVIVEAFELELSHFQEIARTYSEQDTELPPPGNLNNVLQGF